MLFAVFPRVQACHHSAYGYLLAKERVTLSTLPSTHLSPRFSCHDSRHSVPVLCKWVWSSVSLIIVVSRRAPALSIWLSLCLLAPSAWDLFGYFGQAALLDIWLRSAASLDISYSGFGSWPCSFSSGYLGATHSHYHRRWILLFTALSFVDFGYCIRIEFVHRCPHSITGRVCVDKSVKTSCTRNTVASSSCTRMIHEWMERSGHHI